MKAIINAVSRPLVKNNLTWKLLKPFARAGTHLQFLRDHFLYLQQFSAAIDVQTLFREQKVLHGPFAGMKYPSLAASGSTLYPKLLGSYENELQSIIEACCQYPYTEVIDIGCAEGYYAVGFALRQKEARILAYDTNEFARSRCLEMARLNGVTHQLTIKESCTAEELGSFPFQGRTLIICDCEGYERHLFNQDNLANLKNCDVLIETHDFMDIEISGELMALFAATHDVQVIKSVDDIEKAKTYQIEELAPYSLSARRQLVGEYRPAIMEWLFCKARVA